MKSADSDPNHRNFNFGTGTSAGRKNNSKKQTEEWESHEEPQAVIFLHGTWRHIKEFGIEGQIPRISSPVKLEKRC